MCKSPRVCMVIAHFRPAVGGAEKQAEALARGIMAAGSEAFVLTQRAEGLPRAEVIDGLRILREMGGPARRILQGVGYLFSVARVLLRERKRYDIIHCHMMYLHAAAAVPVARALGKRVVVKIACGGMHGDIAGMRRLKGARLWLALCRGADRFVAVSRETADELCGVGVDARRIVMIPNFVDTDSFRPADPERKAALRRALGFPTTGLLVVFVGRLVPQKGIETLLDAWARVASRPDAVLLLVGEGPSRDELDRRARAKGMEGRVRFLGERRDVPDILSASDAFAFHSHSEGMPNALLEAMACGLPCVSSATGGARDIVRDGVNGLLAPPSDPVALAERLGRVIGDAGLRRRLGAAAREEAERRCAAGGVVDRYRALYGELGSASAV